MKHFILLFFIFHVSFSGFLYPPVDMVRSNNLGVSHSLEFYSNFTGNGEYNVENPVSYANLTIELLSPMVDGSILAGNSNYVIFSRNARYSGGGEYNRNGDSGLGGVCEEVLHTDFSNYWLEGNATFFFGNLSSTVAIDGNKSYLEIPDSLSLEDSDGNSTVTVTLGGSFHFNYSRVDILCDSHSGSFTVYYDKTYKVDFHDSRNFTVSGRKHLNLPILPITGEQWYKDNRFNNLVLSSRKFYLADVVLNGAPVASRRMKTFEIGIFKGLQYVNTIDYNDSSSVTIDFYNVSSMPVPLEAGNDSFTYAYVVNSSYAGLGDNNITLVLYDYFGNNISINRMIKSNGLSAYGNLTDVSGNYVRKSAPFVYSEYQTIGTGLGTVILLIVVLYSVRLFGR